MMQSVRLVTVLRYVTLGYYMYKIKEHQYMNSGL